MTSIFDQSLALIGLWLLRAAALPLRHPFFAKRSTLGAVLTFAIAGAFLALVYRPSPQIAGIEIWWTLLFASIGVAPFAITGLVGWHRYLRQAGPDTVHLAKFAAGTQAGKDASGYHQEAIETRLQQGLAGKHITIRLIPAPLGDRECMRLLQESAARAVIFGEIKAIDDEGTFTAVLLDGSAADDLEDQSTPADDHVEEDQRTRTSIARCHRFQPDFRIPLKSLLDERYEARHVDEVEAGLLVFLASDLLADGDRLTAGEFVNAVDAVKVDLTDRLRIQHAVNRVRVAHAKPTLVALRELQGIADRELDHPDLRKIIARLALRGYGELDVPAAVVVGFAEAAHRAAPNEPMVQWMLGQAYQFVEDEVRALGQHLPLAIRRPFICSYDFQITTGAMAYNQGRYAEAQTCYRRAVGLKKTARAHLYLADTLIRANAVSEARHHYRQALLLQPDLVDAHRGYWWKVPAGEETRSLYFDRLYFWLARAPGLGRRHWRRRAIWLLLRLHYRRHPEDSRIHYMLGAHALLDHKLKFAEERLEFARQLDEYDYEAVARLVLVWAHLGKVQKVYDGLRELREMRRRDGMGPSAEDLRERYISLLLPVIEEPRLNSMPGGLLFAEAVAKVFEDISASME